jgi:hypothetical protein
MGTSIKKPTDMQLFKQAILNNELKVETKEKNAVTFTTNETSDLGLVQITFKDKNQNNKIDTDELSVTFNKQSKNKEKTISGNQIPLEVWQGMLQLFTTTQQSGKTSSSSAAEFEDLVKGNFGISSEQLAAKAKQNLEKLEKEANILSKKIKPDAKNWVEALSSLEKDRLPDSAAVMSTYKTEAKNTLKYLQDKGWVPKDIKPIEVVEDKDNMGSGASVDPDTGVFKIETADKASDVYWPATAKSLTVHELVHAVDFQKKGMSLDPLAEGLAYYIEQKAYQEDEKEADQEKRFYKTDAEKLQALKWQIIRNARVIKTAELHHQKTTPEAAKAYFIEKLGMSEEQARAEVEIMRDNPLQKISYVGGSEGITALWKQVQAKYPNKPYSQFLEKLYDQNSDWVTDARIPSIAKKEFGITMK